ncbi:MAG: MlaD family protein [Gemmatimonadaceae bacterium]|jgi:phospholipid/cholesterol/gamma-HCH transport system substrate-binding protein|nr:MlaD family protein [Gemmatimonadaceae bacterium]
MKRRDELLVGLLLIVAAFVAIGGTLWLVRGGLSAGYPMYTRFAWGAGLKVGQPVLLAGVNIGSVDQVELDPKGTILVTLRINSSYQVPAGTTATVQANGIFGDQLIALTPARNFTSFMSRGDSIPVGKPAASTADLIAGADSIEKDVAAILSTSRKQFVDDGGLADVRRTIADMSRLVTQLSRVATEQSAQLTSTQGQLRRVLASVDSMVVDSTLKNVRTTSANVASLTGELSKTNAQLARVLARVDSGGGSAALLMNDPALYKQVVQLLARVDTLTIDFKKNPRKYINLEIF